MADSKGRGFLVKAIGFVILFVVLRANLPPDNVAQSLDMGRLEDKEGLGGIFGRAAAAIITSELVADWEYTDLGVVKIAHSERLDRSALGLPFCKWKILGDGD